MKLLYKQNRMLFFKILESYPDLAWKSLYDFEGKRVSEDTYFIGINTPCNPTGLILNGTSYELAPVPLVQRAPIPISEFNYTILERLPSLEIRRAKTL